MSKALFFFLLILLFCTCKKNEVNPPGPANPPVPVRLALIGSTYIPGNFEKSIKDSFLLQFNKSVQVRHIKFKKDYCLPDIRYDVVNNGTAVKFSNFLCGRLGGEYPFEFSVSDSAGAVLTDSIMFNCYTRKIIMTGNPVNYFITSDNNFCWVTTTSPNQVLSFSLTDTLYKKAYDLNFVPRKAVYNSYNNKIYIFPVLDDYTHRGNIYVMNPATGIIEKTIHLFPDQLNHPQHLDLFAFDIAFGANGYGIILVYDDVFSSRWKIIDSQQNDTIYIHPSFPANGNGNVRLSSFKTSQPNFDKTKIFSLESYGNCRLGVLDCISHTMTEMEHSLSSLFYSNFITTHKLKNDIFFGNVPEGQFIISNGNPVGAVTYFDGRGDAEADFSYRANESNYIYYLDDHLIGIVNYNNGDILMSINFSYDLHQISSTTNGKYIVSIGNNCMEIFDTQLFYQRL